MRVVSLAEFVARPRGGVCFFTENGAFWQRDGGLAGVSVWSAIGPAAVPPFFACLDAVLEHAEAPFDYLADNRRMRLGDHDLASFGLVFEGLQARVERFAGRFRRMASVFPDDALGYAMASGAGAVATHYEQRAFMDYASALAWLGRPDAAAVGAWLEALPALASAQAPLTDRLRSALATSPAASAEALARAIGVSVRTLQRALAQGGTSLRAEQRAARIRQAQAALAEPDAKVAAVAQAVGFRSTSQFIRVYREHVGETPGQTRQRVAAATSDAAPPGPRGGPRE